MQEMSTGRAQPLPFPVRQALIQACGKVFYYKGGLLELFVAAGVPPATVQRYIDEGHVKFLIARHVLDDLDQRGSAGRRVQDQIVEALLGLDGPADDGADPGDAKKALEKLRTATGKRQPSRADEIQTAAVAARRNKDNLQRRAAERQAETMPRCERPLPR